MESIDKVHVLYLLACENLANFNKRFHVSN